MSKEPLLTIAIPTYNGSRTIRQMLDVLLPQITEEVEVFVSDNCSTDGTPQIIKEYQEQYPFLGYSRNEKNLQADGNFLKCMRQASGKFTMLISDDDVIVEGAVQKIISFLKKNPQVSLAFLETVGFRDTYQDIAHCHRYTVQMKQLGNSRTTTDKKIFFDYVRRQWGFTSSFLWNTERCKAINNPEQYFNTYWLQSYIHIQCSDKSSDILGMIAGPIIAAGEYGIIGNYDSAMVEAVKYKDMLDYAVDHAGYDQKQLEEYWVWKVCYLCKRAVIKEKSIGKHITSTDILFKKMKKYPYAWINLFPFLIVPTPVCQLALRVKRKRQGRNYTTYVNRPTE